MTGITVLRSIEDVLLQLLLPTQSFYLLEITASSVILQEAACMLLQQDALCTAEVTSQDQKGQQSQS